MISLIIYESFVSILLLISMPIICQHLNNKDMLNDLIEIGISTLNISEGGGGSRNNAKLLFNEYSIDRKNPSMRGLYWKLNKLLHILDSQTKDYGKIKNKFFIKNEEGIRKAVNKLQKYIEKHQFISNSDSDENLSLHTYNVKQENLSILLSLLSVIITIITFIIQMIFK